MKKILTTFLLVNTIAFSFACEVCKKQQPKVLKGITHGAGPQGQWDYWIIGVTALIVLISLYFSIRWIIRPGERSPAHIKRIILETE